MILKYRNSIIEILTAIFILLFVYTGVSKLIDHNNFKAQFNLLSDTALFGEIFSYLIPIAELAIAAMLAIQPVRLAALYAFIVMMFIFSVYIAYMLLSGKSLPCTCGGVISALSWKQHLVFNGSFIIAGIACLLLNGTSIKPTYLKNNYNSF